MHRIRACGLAEDGHPVGIAAERTDVVVHPLQRKDLVAKTEIVHAAGAEVSQDTEPVGDPDDDDAAVACNLFGVVLGRFAPTRHVRAAMQPDHDGQPVRVAGRRHREHLAVLAHLETVDDRAGDPLQPRR